MKTILTIVLRPSDFIEMNRIQELLSNKFIFKTIYISPGLEQKKIINPTFKEINDDLEEVLKYRRKKKKKKIKRQSHKFSLGKF